MPRYRFHIDNAHGPVRDEEGTVLPDEDAARTFALNSIRSIVADEAGDGLIDLTGRIDVEDDDGNACLTVMFRDAFELRI